MTAPRRRRMRPPAEVTAPADRLLKISVVNRADRSLDRIHNPRSHQSNPDVVMATLDDAGNVIDGCITSDGQGFVASLRTVADPAGTSIVLFGACGAARAIAVEAALAGAARITVINRDRARGEELVSLIAERTAARADLVIWDHRYEVPEGAEIVVIATSVGLSGTDAATLEIDADSLRRAGHLDRPYCRSTGCCSLSRSRRVPRLDRRRSHRLDGR